MCHGDVLGWRAVWNISARRLPPAQHSPAYFYWTSHFFWARSNTTAGAHKQHYSSIHTSMYIRTSKFFGDLAVLHALGLRLLGIEGHVLLADALHVLVVRVLGVCLDDHHGAAGGALHGELPDLGAVVGAGLVLRRVEPRPLQVCACRSIERHSHRHRASKERHEMGGRVGGTLEVRSLVYGVWCTVDRGLSKWEYSKPGGGK